MQANLSRKVMGQMKQLKVHDTSTQTCPAAVAESFKCEILEAFQDMES